MPKLQKFKCDILIHFQTMCFRKIFQRCRVQTPVETKKFQVRKLPIFLLCIVEIVRIIWQEVYLYHEKFPRTSYFSRNFINSLFCIKILIIFTTTTIPPMLMKFTLDEDSIFCPIIELEWKCDFVPICELFWSQNLDFMLQKFKYVKKRFVFSANIEIND